MVDLAGRQWRRVAGWSIAVALLLVFAYLAFDIRVRGNVTAFFTLVGCHGLHVTAGLIWLAVMMAQVAFKGFRPSVDRRLLCFALFWHALDIIWVWLFTAVYLMGIRP